MQKKLLVKITIIAILSALCFGATYISIPLPTGAKVHLGNFVCIIAGLLLGGVSGGIVGSLGMGLNDIACGYVWTTIVRTFVMKFVMGYLVGVLYRYFIKKEKLSKNLLWILFGSFACLFVISIIIYVTTGGVITITINQATKSAKFYLIIPILLGIFTLIFGLCAIFNKKLTHIQKAVCTSTTLAIIVNIIGEFIIRYFLVGITNGFEASLAESIVKIPAGVITGIMTIIIATLIYTPVYKALKNNEAYQSIADLEVDVPEEENKVIEE